LIVIGFAVIIHLITIKRSEKRAIEFSNFETLKKLMGHGVARERNLLPLILRILVLAMIIFAISDFTVTFRGYRSNMDFMLALDTSSSMLNPDVPPTRLEASKHAALDLVEKLPDGTKMGVITFAGEATVKCPMNSNRELLKSSIRDITYSEKAGTAIGDAIVLGAMEMKGISGKKGIILVTDGKNNIGVSVNESVRAAKERNITIFTIGIGKVLNETNETFEIPPEYQNLTGTITITKSEGFDPKTLEMIANQTGGKFYIATNESSLEKIYEGTALEEKVVTIKPTFYLLALAVILLLIEWMLGATKYKTLP